MKQVIATIFAQNTNGKLSCTPARPVSCDNASIEGEEWMTPYVVNGRMEGYRRVLQSAKPSADSVKTIRVRIEGQTYWILVKDTDTVATFSDACNKCCDQGTPTIATTGVPDPIIEDYAGLVDGKYVFVSPLPDLISGQAFTLELTYSEGKKIAAALPAGGFTTHADAVTFLTTNAAALGTFELVGTEHGDLVKLTSTTVKTASIQFPLVSKAKTGTFAFPVTVTSVKHNGITSALPFPVVAANASELISGVASYFADGNLTATSATEIKYEGTGVPTSIGAVAFA